MSNDDDRFFYSIEADGCADVSCASTWSALSLLTRLSTKLQMLILTEAIYVTLCHTVKESEKKYSDIKSGDSSAVSEQFPSDGY